MIYVLFPGGPTTSKTQEQSALSGLRSVVMFTARTLLSTAGSYIIKYKWAFSSLSHQRAVPLNSIKSVFQIVFIFFVRIFT